MKTKSMKTFFLSGVTYEASLNAKRGAHRSLPRVGVYDGKEN